MDIDQKVNLITRNCQEVLTEEDLRSLIENNTQLTHYIGFEISGLIHLGTGHPDREIHTLSFFLIFF
jgi:tyrosyl-tRNA synthetase